MVVLPLCVVMCVLFGGWGSASGAEESAPDVGVSSSGQFSPIGSGWVLSDSAALLLENAAPLADSTPPLVLADASSYFSAGSGARSWCLGDDTDTDWPGDAGPDLLWFRMSGACRGPGSLLAFEVLTERPAGVVELVINTDLDLSTGCDGNDLFYLAQKQRLFQVQMSSCDAATWTSYDAGHYGVHDSEGKHLSFTVPAEVGANSVWYVGVANDDGSGYDASWTFYRTINALIECNSEPSPTPDSAGGYWLAGMDGSMWSFGSAPDRGHACRSGNAQERLVDLEAYPLVGDHPATWAALYADASINTGAITQTGPIAPEPWEVGATEAVALLPRPDPALPNVLGFWVIYDNGAVVPIGLGDVPFFGDLREYTLNQPIIDAVGTPDGQGYWLVGLDGGVFGFGSASFRGSMGGVPLNEPVVAMVADPDGQGYWLVASDGGVFAFDAPFVGSIPGVLTPGQRLNKPIVGMIPYGNGYLMLASDGGVFNFSDRPFAGSLGGAPPAAPIVGVAALPEALPAAAGPTPDPPPPVPDPPPPAPDPPPPPAADLAITTSVLPAVYAGQPYQTTLQATGGEAPLSWSISSGGLPAGMTLDQATGVMGGVASAPAAEWSFTVRVTDQRGIPAQRSFTLASSSIAKFIGAADPATFRRGSGNASISHDGQFVAHTIDTPTLFLDGAWVYRSQIYLHDRDTGESVLASRTPQGDPANSGSGRPIVSGDGRFVVFQSGATDLTADPPGVGGHVFLFDRTTLQVTLLSRSIDGGPANLYAWPDAISGDGRYVLFGSKASDIVANDHNNQPDVFLYDRDTNVITAVSRVGSRTANHSSTDSEISADGRYVVFSSRANDLVPGDTNGYHDIFLHHIHTGLTTLLSRTPDGALGDGTSGHATISGDGRYVAFTTSASNLLETGPGAEGGIVRLDQTTGQLEQISPWPLDRNAYSPVMSDDGQMIAYVSWANDLIPELDQNGEVDVFLFDGRAGTTRLISAKPNGHSPTLGSGVPVISGDGRWLMFPSGASALVPGDDNNPDDFLVRVG